MSTCPHNMHNSFHGTVITFKGAMVYRNKGDVVVDGQFFGFRLKNGTLEWLENYGRKLYLQKKQAAKKVVLINQPSFRR